MRARAVSNTRLIPAGLIVALVVALDLATKSWALRTLSDGRSIEALSGLLPLNLTFNRGAAFGITIGDDPRWFFVPVTLVAIGFLVLMIWQAPPGEGWRTSAASLVLGGALGNLYDRVRWDAGVVDFIGPVDLGFMDWPIFNVADSAITCGAILLAISFLAEDLRSRRASGNDEGEERVAVDSVRKT